MMCRVMNPSSKPVIWPAGHAFAYLTSFDVDAMGVNQIDMTDCIAQTDKCTPDEDQTHKVFTMTSIEVPLNR